MPEPLSPNSGLGMKVAVLPLRPRDVLDDVLELQHVVGGVRQRVELVVDLGLAGGADLVVGALELEAGVDQRAAHLVAQVGVVVDRRHREVAALVPGLVAAVAALLDAAGVPGALDRVDVVDSPRSARSGTGRRRRRRTRPRGRSRRCRRCRWTPGTASALAATWRGSRSYGSPVRGSTIEKLRLSVLAARNGST